jgi:hypothetical protein
LSEIAWRPLEIPLTQTTAGSAQPLQHLHKYGRSSRGPRKFKPEFFACLARAVHIHVPYVLAWYADAVNAHLLVVGPAWHGTCDFQMLLLSPPDEVSGAEYFLKNDSSTKCCHVLV